jgi:hypothetical protein
VVDKNETWHSRYRTVDSFNIFGGRSKLSYESGKGGPKISNAEVMHAGDDAARCDDRQSRQARVGGRQGRRSKVDDSNLPPVTQVKTNHPGTNPDGSHVFLSGEEAIKHMTMPQGLQGHAVRQRRAVPGTGQAGADGLGYQGPPVDLGVDELPGTHARQQGWRQDPDHRGHQGHGKADKVTTFLGDLNCPTGFQFYKDGILVMESPDLWYVRDTTGSGQGRHQGAHADGPGCGRLAP